jgi:hypothetical protein
MTSRILRPAAAGAALAAVGALCLHTGGSPALAAAPRAGHTFTFVTAGAELAGKSNDQVGLFHGAIDGGGKDVPHAQSDVVHLPGGSITVKHPDSQSTFVPKVDQSTCYVTFKITGKFTLTHGTGRYHGVSGSGTYTGHGYGYLVRGKNGRCNMNAAPQSEVFQIAGHGTRG